MKTCNRCHITQPIDEFYRKRRNPDGREYTCKTCLGPQDRVRTRKKSVNPPREPSKNQKRLRSFKKAIRQAGLQLALKRISEQEFQEIVSLNEAKITTAILEGRREWERQYERKRAKSGAVKACTAARHRVSMFLRGKKRYSKTLGCSFEEFKAHVEGLFQPGMTWDNYGEWQLDHEIPLALAYFNGPEEFKVACLYTNLQPLWVSDHKIKTAEDIKLIKTTKLDAILPKTTLISTL